MTKPSLGRRIIESLEEAVAGHLDRVTINGELWIRAGSMVAGSEELVRIQVEEQNACLKTLETLAAANRSLYSPVTKDAVDEVLKQAIEAIRARGQS